MSLKLTDIFKFKQLQNIYIYNLRHPTIYFIYGMVSFALNLYNILLISYDIFELDKLCQSTRVEVHNFSVSRSLCTRYKFRNRLFIFSYLYIIFPKYIIVILQIGESQRRRYKLVLLVETNLHVTALLNEYTLLGMEYLLKCQFYWSTLYNIIRFYFIMLFSGNTTASL